MIVLSSADHSRLHNWISSCGLNLKKLSEDRMNSGKPKLFHCKYCGKVLDGSKTTFCSVSCQNKGSSKKPLKEKLIGKTISEISSEYGVTPKTARKWFHSYEITWQS